MTTDQSAHVVFVGAGPGAVDLLTVRAARELERAEVVLHDALGCDAVLALCLQATQVPVGKRAGGVSTEQAFINRRLVTEALTGRRIVRLKGGDPTIFGRLDEEISALQNAGVTYEIVPGITAASAAAAHAGVPLTRRGMARSVTLATPAVERGADRSAQWLNQCDPLGTSVIYMAGRELRATALSLIKRGYPGDTGVKIARAVSTAAQRIVSTSLGELALPVHPEHHLDHHGPCVVLVGNAIVGGFSDPTSVLPEQLPACHGQAALPLV
ncbi:MAG: uroporphyrinogen-III C-methyltransferase [Burkholderiaceae bacterium]